MKRTVVHYIDSKEFGGAEQMVFTILKCLDRNTWEPVLIYHPYPGISQFIEKVSELDLKVVSLPEIKNWRDVSSFILFIRELRHINPSVFHAHIPWHLRCSYGILCAFIARVPVIVATVHAYQVIRGQKQTIIQKLISILVDRYIAVSHGIAKQFKKIIPFQDKVLVIHNGICIDRFCQAHDYDPLSLMKDKKGLNTILMIARMDKYKGYEDLISAAATIPYANFVLVGEGPEKQSFERKVEKLGIKNRVFFLGYREDIPSLLRSCDLFILPSLFEGLPLTILEAMAAEKLVIASHISGIDEIITDGKTGFLVPPKDPETLSSVIKTCISNPDITQKVARAGNTLVKKEFSAKKMLQGITDLYEELLFKVVNDKR